MPLERDLLRDRAYAAIRDAIVDGTLAPGERLRDAELCKWLGLSRTPVREALGRLEQDGLVESAPQRYTQVAPLYRREVRTRSRSSPASTRWRRSSRSRASPPPTWTPCAPPTGPSRRR